MRLGRNFIHLLIWTMLKWEEMSPLYFSLKHKALVNDKVLSMENVLGLQTHKQRRLEGEGSEVCIEDPDNLEHAGKGLLITRRF